MIKIRQLTSFIFAALSLLCACNSQPKEIPAIFDVVSLDVTPSQAITGQEVTVTAKIANSGGMPGNYTAVLKVDGQQIANKTINIPANTSKTATFSISKDKAGTYSIKLENLSAILQVRALVEKEKEVELKYDNGTSRDALWTVANGGFLIDFTPPGKPFKIKKVRICGGIYGTAWEGKNFELSILDKDKKVITNQIFPVDKFPVRGAFPYQPPIWVDINVPETNINDKFYVYLYTNMTKHHGIHVGVDDSVTNEHSDIAQGKPPNLTVKGMETVYPISIWYSDSTKVNWMIRVVGTTLVSAE